MPTYQNNAAIWKNQTKKGDTYLSFRADRDIKKGEKLNFFSNNRKTDDKHPDFTSYEKLEEVKEDVDIDSIPF